MLSYLFSFFILYSFLLLLINYILSYNVISYRVYCIHVSLHYENAKISPVGMFSAASMLDSFVGEMRVNKVWKYCIMYNV